MKTKEEIKDLFYQDKLSNAFNSLLENFNRNGIRLTKAQIKENYILFPANYEDSLFDLLNENNYWNNRFKLDDLLGDGIVVKTN